MGGPTKQPEVNPLHLPAAAALWVMAEARDDRAALAAAMVLVIILAAASTLAVRWWGVPDIEAPIAAARGIALEVAR